jgi:peptide/nickel transport system substrate-binding protein
MRVRRASAILAIVAIAAVLAGCTTGAPVSGSTVTVGVNQPFTSYNPATGYGSTAVNQQVAYATNSGFEYYDDHSRLVADTSFGTVRRISTSPLRVRYTIDAGVKWSDGTPVDAADLLLAWAATSGALNTRGFDPTPYTQANGALAPDFPKDVVWFDGRTAGGRQYAASPPTIGSDGRSITLDYGGYFADWRSAFTVGLPAHVVAEKALGIASATKAKAAVIEAITRGSTTELAALSRVWNSGFNVSAGGIDASLLVGDGPYAVSSVAGDGSVTLRANPRYTGDNRPSIQKVVVRPVSSATKAIAGLADGSLDVITPPATAGTVKALLNLRKITVASGYDASFEHLDLQFAKSRSGYFDDPLVREAFLKVVPRTQIVDRVTGEIQEEGAPRSSFVQFPGTDAYAKAVAHNGSSAYAAVDIAGAEALLRQAGVSAPTVCILFDPTNSRRVTEFDLIRASAAKAGFVVTDCSSPDWASRLGVAGAYDASLSGWSSASPAVTTELARLHSGDSRNDDFYASEITDGLLGTLATATTGAKRQRILDDIDRQLFDDAYGLPLYQLPSITAFRTTVGGVSRSPFAPGVFWNIWEWRPTG